MKKFIGKKVLATTSDYFIAPNGLQYRSVFGTLHSISEDLNLVGFKVNRSHTNYAFEIGNTVIMGCRVMYIIQVNEVNTESVNEWTLNEGEIKFNDRPSNIYLADGNK